MHRQVSQWTLEAVTQQPVFCDRVEDVPVVMQQQAPTIQMVQKSVETPQDHDRIAPRKREISMESESGGSLDEMSDAAHGLVQGREYKHEVDETRNKGPGNVWRSKWRLTGGLVAHTPGHDGGTNRGSGAARDPSNG